MNEEQKIDNAETANGIKQYVSGSACNLCGGINTIANSELEYNDGADEPHTGGNYLITVWYLYCNDCGEHCH